MSWQNRLGHCSYDMVPNGAITSSKMVALILCIGDVMNDEMHRLHG